MATNNKDTVHKVQVSPSRLLALPQELQDIIYSYTFPKVVEVDATYRAPALLRALRTNHRVDIFRRAQVIYYKTSTFISLHKPFEDITAWLKSRGDLAAFVQDVRIPRVLKCPKDYLEYVRTDGKGAWQLGSWKTGNEALVMLLDDVVWMVRMELKAAGVLLKDDVVKVPLISVGGVVVWTSRPMRELGRMLEEGAYV